MNSKLCEMCSWQRISAIPYPPSLFALVFLSFAAESLHFIESSLLILGIIVCAIETIFRKHCLCLYLEIYSCKNFKAMGFTVKSSKILEYDLFQFCPRSLSYRYRP